MPAELTPAERKTLKRLSSLRLPDGRSSVVAVVGAGLHMQFRPKGGAKNSPLVSFDALLEGLGAPSESPLQAPLRFEELVRSRCTRKRAAHECEKELTKEACLALRAAVAPESRQAIRETFAGAQDIISLNIDDALAPPRARPSKVGQSSSTVRAVERPQQRVWFPHGHVASPSTVVLGVRAYGLHLSELDDWRRGYMSQEYRWKKRSSVGEGRSAAERRRWNRHYRSDLPLGVISHVGLFLSAPLVFVGTSLAQSEWDLWWLLNQRARNFARLPAASRPPTVWLGGDLDASGKRLSPHLDARPAGVEAVRFGGDYRALWEATAEIFSPPAPV